MKYNHNFLIFFICFTSIHPVLAQKHQIKTYFDAEKEVVKEQFFVKNSSNPILHGLYEAFYSDGSIKTRGYYKNNVPDSLWMYFYENGGIKASGNIKQGKKFGLWQFFYENGNINMKGHIYGNKKEGPWKYFYENGQLKTEGEYQKGKKEGLWRYFYEDGTLKADAFFEDGKGIFKKYYSNGALKSKGLHNNGKSDSTWIYYYENGNVKAKGNYKNGLKEGIWTYFHPNGNVSAKGMFVRGKKDGKWTYFHQNGKISSEGALLDGKKEGHWKLYNKLGKFKGDGIFKQGDGSYNEYYENGNIKVEGQIKNGKNHGVWKYYYEDGNLEGKCDYQYGKGEFTGYYPDGSIYMKGKIKNGKNVGLWKLYKPNGDLAGYYRPFYEGDKPVYELMQDVKNGNVIRGNNGYLKPEYKYNPNKLRYFSPVVNEFKGVIVGANPLAMPLGRFPVSLEYYYQERLGYEMQVSYLRKPFFTRDAKVDVNERYARGFDAAIRQKFYHPEQKLGMFYFAHELRFTNLSHKSNVIDSTNAIPNVNVIEAKENKIEYAIMFGNRWMKTYGEKYLKDSNTKGITLDIYIGMGIGYRSFTKNFMPNESFDEIYNDHNQNNLSITPRVGINFGYVF